MTLRQFDNGYWYATQLKDFGKAIRIPSAGKLRKDELGKAIRSFLVTGKARNPQQMIAMGSGDLDLDLLFVPLSDDPVQGAGASTARTSKRR
jgi:SAP domain-containing protein